MRRNVLIIIVLVLTTFAAGVTVCRATTAVKTDVAGLQARDFVHDVSAFDICFPVFRAMATGNSHYVNFMNGRGTLAGSNPNAEKAGSWNVRWAELPDPWQYVNWNNAEGEGPRLHLKGRCVKFLRTCRRTMLRDTAYDEEAEKS